MEVPGFRRYKDYPNGDAGIRVHPQKLSTLCITSIIDAFDRFMIEYESSSSVPKMNFEYLQRVGSKTILGEIKSRAKAAPKRFYINPLEYYKFILNPFLKEIDLSSCNKWITTPIIGHLATIGNTITKLHLEGCSCSPVVIHNLISQIPKVKSLTLHKCIITQSELECIGKHCLDLQNLNLAGCPQVRDIAIESLCPVNENSECRSKNYTLQQLNVQDTAVTAKGVIFALKHFPNMISITHNFIFDVIHNIYESFETDDLPIFKFNELTRLTILYGVGFKNDHKLQSCSILCPNITELTLHCIDVQAQVDACISFTALKYVEFKIITYMPIDLLPFFEARGANLEMVSVANAKISAKALIKFCPKLKSLSLYNIKFEPAKELEVNEFNYTFQYLEELCIDGMDPRLENIEIFINLLLSASPNLKEFKLFDAHELTSHFINLIIAHNFIIHALVIDFKYSCISEQNIAMLISAAPNLKELYYKR